MTALLFADAAARPDLFRWNGALDRQQLSRWLSERLAFVPDDYLDVLAFTGGGEIFESEDLLDPHDHDFGIDAITALQQANGLAATEIVFHVGAWISTLDTRTGAITIRDLDLVPDATRPSDLASWYEGWLRAEYAERYGLA